VIAHEAEGLRSEETTLINKIMAAHKLRIVKAPTKPYRLKTEQQITSLSGATKLVASSRSLVTTSVRYSVDRGITDISCVGCSWLLSGQEVERRERCGVGAGQPNN
jgi:hypothetical protein